MLAKSVLRNTVVQRGVVPFKPVRVSTGRARLSKPVSPVRCEAAEEPAQATAVADAPAAAVEEVAAPVSDLSAEGPRGGYANTRFQRGSPFKIRRILDLIRGKSYVSSLAILQMLPYKACEPIVKVLMSAAANAKNNNGATKAFLYVSECTADGGPTMKRMRPRAQGRGVKILKPTFHMSIKLEETLPASAKDAEKFMKGLKYKSIKKW
eukprot:gene18875-25433_t